MKRLAFLLASLSLAACGAEDSPAADDCLPGDIDCAPAGGGGDNNKGDAFDYKNDPARMSQHLTCTLATLPKKGFRTQPVWKNDYPGAVGKAEAAWTDTYWPTS